jgi:hypothetical protein
MGEAADRKVNEIEATRNQLEVDLRELEERMPAPLRSVKGVVGALVGSAGGAFVLRKLLSRRSEKRSKAEVIVRVVREDQVPKG